MSKSHPDDNFFKKCRDNNLKITLQRTAIYHEIANDLNHPSADTIYKRVRTKYPNISFDTVNRTLISFSGIGLMKVVEGYGSPKRYDPNTDNHHHFQCVKCGKITDFQNKEYDELRIPNEIKKKYTIYSKKVVLEGVCGKCKR